MERHLDLVRAVLLETERNASPVQPIVVQAPGYSPDQIAYHVKLLDEAGYLDALDLSTVTALDWHPRALTWQGHEFLDAARNDSIWQQVKATLKDRGVEAPLSVVQKLAAQLVASRLGVD